MESLNDKAMFFGKVTASVTHEIQNVLAIIKENSGLMEDFLLLNQTDGLSGIEDKLKQCIKTIKNQAYRGVGLTSGLNGFAHTTDSTEVSVNIFEIIKKMIAITERLFQQKNVSILMVDSEKAYSTVIDPIFFQMVAFSCIECLIDNFGNSRPITLEIRLCNNVPGIEFSYNGKDLNHENYKEKIIQDPQWEKITKLCGQINLSVEIPADTFGILVTFK